jgi:predicted anti-sigma-YlaC factor YlaD
MSQERQSGMECSRFEALLADALDGVLTAESSEAFEAHRLSCSICGPLFEEAREGMMLLERLPEVEPPRNLAHNILAATSLAEKKAAATAAPESWLERLKQRLPSPMAGMLHSRFATSFAMAFFSLALTLNLLGVRVSQIDWRPSALRKSVVLEYTHLEARVQRYYENMRIVYEVESRVQGLKKATTPDQNRNNNRQEQNRNTVPGRKGQPEDNNSLEQNGFLFAQSTVKHEGATI